ncbi:MAG TPA: NADPH-dependent FMN reductase [Kofleriaceae bacterium]|nr:NADPH-dependent FMN reductase [Kofleriaceae bacterium]
MTTIIGISGSLRRGSYNSALLRAAAELAPEEVKIEIASIRGIPLYDGDVEEADGVPAPVTELKDRIAAAGGLLLVTPEYNASVPGVLKNAIDWMSRPAKDIPRVFGDKPVGLMGATPGPGGTRLSQTAWLPVFRLLNMRPYFARLVFLHGAAAAFDADGRLIDDKLRDLVTRYMAGLAEFIG